MSAYQLKNCVCLSDFREAARKDLKTAAFQYIDSGSEDEKTLKLNSTSFHKLMIVPRILTSSRQVHMSTTIFGKKLDLPFGFAPWAMNQLVHPQGQKLPARVAYQNKLIYTLSSLSTKSFKDILESNKDGMRLMQLYISNDWNLTMTIIRCAQQYGFTGLVITVDAQTLGVRRKQNEQGLDYSSLLFPVLDQFSKVSAEGKRPLERRSFLANRDMSLSWETIDKIRKNTTLKVIVKGVMHPKDAQIAIKHCDAVWISNHGGRQLDGVSSTIDILPSIKATVGNRIPIFVDGGIRTGSDLYKCIAFGADYVFLGRPVAFSMVFGYQGVKKLVDILADELRRTMILVGCSQLKDINASSIVPQPSL